MSFDSFEVGVRCFTYNHAKYIEETMNGFAMQQTSFPYICVIVDDASTDDEASVIQNYVDNNFDAEDATTARKEENDDYIVTFARHKTNKNCFFAVYLLKYNHYSIRKSKMPYIAKITDCVKYLAICEGDDYWIDQQKLQTQFDYMDNHPQCTMTCHRAQLYSEKSNKIIGEQYCRNSDGDLSPVDIINRTGLFIPTCSIMYRPEIRKNYPDYCQNCNVGDYPLQITAAMKGSVYYFNKSMSVYRIGNITSWMGRQRHESTDPARLKVVCGQKKMFEGFAKDYPQYKKVMQDKISEHILRNMPRPKASNNDEMLEYQKIFSEVFDNLSYYWKLYYFACKSRIPYVKKLFRRIVVHNYTTKQLIYRSPRHRLIAFLKIANNT